MTSIFIKHSIKCFSSCSSLSGRRAIHSTSVVHKKMQKVDIENLFEDEIAFEPDLFAEPKPDKTILQNDATTATTTTTTTAKDSSSSTVPTEGSSTVTPKRRVSAPSDSLKRSALLNKHIHFMKPRLGSSPSKKHPRIRSRTWLTMIQLAKNGEDMTKVVELIPMFHVGGGALPNLFAEVFVRRCEQLGCQPLALEVFGNYAKYNITLTPDAGRWLIHSLHVLHPLKDLLIAASLYSIYNMSFADDLVSASMLTAACFKHDTPQSRAVANVLLPKIKTMVEEKKLTTPVRDIEMKRQLKWLDWSLRKINKFVKKSSGEPLVPLTSLLPISQPLPSTQMV